MDVTDKGAKCPRCGKEIKFGKKRTKLEGKVKRRVRISDDTGLY
jgi:ribosomal protein L28